MFDIWHVGGTRERVVVQRWFSDAPPGGAWDLAPDAAADRVNEWFPLGSGELTSRFKLMSIAGALHLFAGPTTETRVLRELAARAFRERALVARQFPVAEVSFDSRSGAEPEPPPPAPPPPAEKKTWIAVELLMKTDGKPIGGARYSLKLPDGSTRSGSLDGRGTARIDGIEDGECDVDFPDYAPPEWGATATPGGGFDYKVQQGDCLSSLAEKFRCADWHTIYDASENADFRRCRPDPNIIFPGDSIHIPGRNLEPERRSTGQKHTFRLTATGTRFRVRIQFGVPFTYHLDVEGSLFDGALDDGAIIDVPIEPRARAGRLSIWPSNDLDRDPLEFAVALGGLDPVDEPSGVQARLNNLGFDCGKVDGIVGPRTARALSAFQGVAGLGRTGTIDEATRDALSARHDLS